MNAWHFAVPAAAYFIGAIPFGFLIGKLHGIDIRKVGSGNIGATNVTRSVGKAAGKLCFFLDFLKGILPVYLAGLLCPGEPVVALAAGAATIAGHMFPIYLEFKGGKGVSTAAGVALALAPYPLLIAFAGWVVVFLVWRYVSLASIVAAVLLPCTAILFALCKIGGATATSDMRVDVFYYDFSDVYISTVRAAMDEQLKAMGIDGRLKNLFVDDAKNFWFLTEDNTFSFYDVKAGKKKVVDRGDSDFTRRYGVPVELAQYKNFCWIVYSKGLVRCYDYTSSEFLFQDSHFEGRINEYTDRICLHPDSIGNLWLMYNNGVSFYNRTMREWTDVASISGISNFFTCMDMDREGNLWVGTSRSGLRHIDAEQM